ncbi:glycosyltransferase family 4 protein, partial [Alphaproteobacteria bacterium]|nr:glycosyltransferase family 4 protein [Alphaproteobacteria bacterium]
MLSAKNKNNDYKVLNLVFNSIVGDARVQRTSRLLSKWGYRVIVCSVEENDRAYEFDDTFLCHIPMLKAEYSSIEAKTMFWKVISFFCSKKLFRQITLYHKYVCLNQAAYELIEKHRPDILICNNFESLRAGYFAKQNMAIPFVYDAHELEKSRSTGRSKLQKLYVNFFEWFYARKADEVITVSRGIADILSKRFNRKNIHLFHNSPYFLSSFEGVPLRDQLKLLPT